jgi:hypothetical protein
VDFRRFQFHHHEPAVERGWFPLVFDLFLEIEGILGPHARDFEMELCGERWGFLRCVVHFEKYVPTDLQDAVRIAIAVAELASGKICEVCGKPGKIADWRENTVQSLCREHALDMIFRTGNPELPGFDIWKVVSAEPHRFQITDNNGRRLLRDEVDRLIETATRRIAACETRARATKSAARRRRLIQSCVSDTITCRELGKFAFIAEWE